MAVSETDRTVPSVSTGEYQQCVAPAVSEPQTQHSCTTSIPVCSHIQTLRIQTARARTAMTGSTAALAPSAMTHKGVRLSRDIQDLSYRSFNIVLIKRPHAAVSEHPTKLLSRPVQAVLDVHQAEEGMHQLLSGVAPGLQQQLQQDLQQAVKLFSSTLQVRHVTAKLEGIKKQSCPKWHADFVRMRMLCTYAGPGTWCMENRFVEREWHLDTGMVSVAGVEEGQRIEAAAGDLLFLKGQNYPGLYGAGAVHKSPELRRGESRLLLTVDDGCC